MLPAVLRFSAIMRTELAATCYYWGMVWPSMRYRLTADCGQHDFQMSVLDYDKNMLAAPKRAYFEMVGHFPQYVWKLVGAEMLPLAGNCRYRDWRIQLERTPREAIDAAHRRPKRRGLVRRFIGGWSRPRSETVCETVCETVWVEATLLNRDDVMRVR